MDSTANKQQIEEVLLRCRRSTKETALSFFGPLDDTHPMDCHFFAPFDPPHDAIFQVLDHPTWNPEALKRGYRQAYNVIAAPRGTGKTTIVSIPFIARELLFGLSRYVVYIGATQDAAMEQTESLKNELLNNQMVRTVFGDIKSESFAQEKWDIMVGRSADGGFLHRARVLPLGRGGKIRGRKQGYARPDLIILDDVEDDECVQTEEQRKKLWDWLNTAVLNSVGNRGHWRVIWIGTMLHYASALARLLQMPEWNPIKLSLCTPQYESLYPNFMTTEQIKALVETHRRNDTLTLFAKEYMNTPVAEETRAFKREYFRYYDEATAKLNDDPDTVNVVLIDPARTTKEGACMTAIVGVGIRTLTNQLFVRDVVEEHFTTDALYEAALGMCARLNARILAVEVTGLDEYITGPLQTAIFKSRLPVIMVEVKPRDKKERRPAGLLPYYRMGDVFHNRTCCGTLEDRLEEWPACASWDAIDAFDMIIPVMEQHSVWFESSNKPPKEAEAQSLVEDSTGYYSRAKALVACGTADSEWETF